MKKHWRLIAASMVVAFSAVYAARLNSVTGQTEGMDFARFQDVIQKSPAARIAFLANLAGTQALSGAGAVNVTSRTTKLTTTGSAQALTLADGATDGQIKIITHVVDGGSAVLTPTTKTGYTTITFTNVGECAVLVWTTTTGWMIVSLNGAVAA